METPETTPSSDSGPNEIDDGDTVLSKAAGAVKSTYTALALDNQDITEQIFSHFESLGNGLKSDFEFEMWLNPDPLWGSDLLNAALSCKSFLSPALDVLWKVLDHLDILFPLIPGLLLIDGTYVLTESLTEGSLERFNLYARRVRQLFFSPKSEGGVLANPTTVLLSRKFPTVLLPNLRLLHLAESMEQSSVDKHTCLIPFIPTTVSFARISATDSTGDRFINTLLSIMSEQSPRLRYLLLTGVLRKSCSELSKFRGLIKLELSVQEVDSEIVENISRIVSVQTLKVYHVRVYNQPPGPNITHSFPSLQVLTCTGHPTAVNSMLTSMWVPNVLNFQICCTGCEDTAPVARCFRTALQKSGSALRRVLQYAGEIIQIPILFSELISARLKIIQLLGWRPTSPRSTTLIFPSTVIWTSLQCLYLPFYKTARTLSEDPPHFALDALSAVATSCPNLNRLAICIFVQFGATNGESDWEVSLSRLPKASIKHHLQRLKLGLVNEPQGVESGSVNWKLGVAISRYIDRIFPFAFMEDSQENQPELDMIYTMLKAYRAVRQEMSSGESVSDME